MRTSTSCLGQLALVLHAHLPFVRHPEHDRFLEENWLFEAVAESYLPLLEALEGWRRDGLRVALTVCLSPTLCAMLRDPLLQTRCTRHLDGLVELSAREMERTICDETNHQLACMYHDRFLRLRELWVGCDADLVSAFGRLQEEERLEIITCAATHAILPLLTHHPAALAAQVRVACDHHRDCFGREPKGIWLPECAYAEPIERALHEAKIQWFILDTHGIVHARPRPQHGIFAPIFTPNGLAAFGRDLESAKQVWSRHEGYPGDPDNRDFYRDIGFDLDLDYVKPFLPAPDVRTFTGIKYHAITGPGVEKRLYNPEAARQKIAAHASHFLHARREQMGRTAALMKQPPLVVAPYDAELFGHWWHEGPQFLDAIVRQAAREQVIEFVTPGSYLREHPIQQVARPGSSSWGEEGYFKVWLNEHNQWIYPHLDVAQTRMTELARRFQRPRAQTRRALNQAGRELLLAQASDWPFMLRTGTNPEFARRCITEHLSRFNRLYDQLTRGRLDSQWLAELEGGDNLFPNLDYRWWS